jgi:hypothetical protein
MTGFKVRNGMQRYAQQTINCVRNPWMEAAALWIGFVGRVAAMLLALSAEALILLLLLLELHAGSMDILLVQYLTEVLEDTKLKHSSC